MRTRNLLFAVLLVAALQGCTLYKIIATVEPVTGTTPVVASTPVPTPPPDRCKTLIETWAAKFNDAADDPARQAQICELLEKLAAVCEKPSDELWEQVHERIKELDSPPAS